MNKINLVVVAHPDDEVLGFGAAGAKLVNCGEVVQPIILCGNVGVRELRPTDEQLHSDVIAANAELGFNIPVLGMFPNISMNTVPHVEIVQFIEKQIEKFKPNRIFTHHPGDLNDDHVQVSKACQAAARLYQRRKDIPALESFYFMEILSSTDWSFATTGENFIPSNFVEIGEEFLNKKIKSLSHYRNVMRPFPHPRSEEVLKALAAYRGGQSGLNYAEAFQLVFKQGI